MKDSEGRDAVDVDRALLDPESVFATPEALLRHDGLSRSQKIETLRRWAYDASGSSVALEEGMRGEESDLLRRILLALDRLGGRIDGERSGASKQHGIPRPPGGRD